MKLISMTDFVLQIEAEVGKEDYQVVAWQTKIYGYDRINKYANFLKQPLTLGMFVPCNDDGNILKVPLNYMKWLKRSVNIPYDLDLDKYYAYQQAQSKVIFKDFYLDETYKREPRQLPYLTNGKISVFLHSDFAIRHQFIEDLVDSDLDCTVSF